MRSRNNRLVVLIRTTSLIGCSHKNDEFDAPWKCNPKTESSEKKGLPYTRKTEVLKEASLMPLSLFTVIHLNNLPFLALKMAAAIVE